jgi:hypothetical protein
MLFFVKEKHGKSGTLFIETENGFVKSNIVL